MLPLDFLAEDVPHLRLRDPGAAAVAKPVHLGRDHVDVQFQLSDFSGVVVGVLDDARLHGKVDIDSAVLDAHVCFLSLRRGCRCGPRAHIAKEDASHPQHRPVLTVRQLELSDTAESEHADLVLDGVREVPCLGNEAQEVLWLDGRLLERSEMLP